jgi:hypothetical protein
MKTTVKLVVIAIATLGAACQTSSEPKSEAPSPIPSGLAQPGGGEPLKDAPAGKSAADLRSLFRQGRQATMSLAVYDLADVAPVKAGALSARAAALGLSGVEDPAPDNHRLGLTAGTVRLTRNENSGAEFFADTARFHRGDGVTRDKLLSDAEYFSKGRAHVDRAFGAEASQAALHPYKIRKYLNASGPADGPPGNAAVYQVAVAFNSAVDGIPIIGPGSKVVVHMTPSGEVIGHEASLRAPKAKRTTISGAHEGAGHRPRQLQPDPRGVRLLPARPQQRAATAGALLCLHLRAHLEQRHGQEGRRAGPGGQGRAVAGGGAGRRGRGSGTQGRGPARDGGAGREVSGGR